MGETRHHELAATQQTRERDTRSAAATTGSASARRASKRDAWRRGHRAVAARREASVRPDRSTVALARAERASKNTPPRAAVAATSRRRAAERGHRKRQDRIGTAAAPARDGGKRTAPLEKERPRSHSNSSADRLAEAGQQRSVVARTGARVERPRGAVSARPPPRARAARRRQGRSEEDRAGRSERNRDEDERERMPCVKSAPRWSCYLAHPDSRAGPTIRREKIRRGSA